jgi:UPF0176 protein
MPAVTPYVNISAYKFISITDAAELRPRYRALCEELDLKGTILLSPEGINLFLAGSRAEIDGFLGWLRSDARFADIEVKESGSDSQPFKRMLVKLKPEIITMRHPLIRPELGRAPPVSPSVLKRWLDSGVDDAGRPVVMLDTRNAFEVDVGTFDHTVDYCIDKFSDFPEVVARHRADFDGKTVVTFCTGGIRCEKAAIHMQESGFDSVYQLDGGILKYFEEVGGAHYSGDCFVFDHRTALNPDLAPREDGICPSCGGPATAREQLIRDASDSKTCKSCCN